MTVGEFLFDAYVMAGMANPRDGALDAQIAPYAFRKTNQLIDLLKTKRLLMYRRQRTGPFAVTAGMGDITAASPITIGVGATWNTPRPVWIDYAAYIYTAGGTPRPELPMNIYTPKEWAQITVKGVTATLSYALIYDQTYTNPDGWGHIYLYPVPSASFQIVLYSPIAIAEFPLDADGNPDYTTVIAMPPGYQLMLTSNMAKIAALGVKELQQSTLDLAKETLEACAGSNAVQHMDPLRCEDAVLGADNNNSTPYNWITGGIQ